MLTSRYDQIQSETVKRRIGAVTRMQLRSKSPALFKLDDAGWDAVEADPEVQMWLRQLDRADAMVRKIEANVEDYVEMIDAFDPHLVGRHWIERKNKALEQFAYTPRGILWQKVQRKIAAAAEQHELKGAA